MNYRRIKPRPSVSEQIKAGFDMICKKCGSHDVHLRYEKEGGYSEYTQWGSSLSIGCNGCKDNDMYLDADY